MLAPAGCSGRGRPWLWAGVRSLGARCEEQRPTGAVSASENRGTRALRRNDRRAWGSNWCPAEQESNTAFRPGGAQSGRTRALPRWRHPSYSQGNWGRKLTWHAPEVPQPQRETRSWLNPGLPSLGGKAPAPVTPVPPLPCLKAEAQSPQAMWTFPWVLHCRAWPLWVVPSGKPPFGGVPHPALGQAGTEVSPRETNLSPCWA